MKLVTYVTRGQSAAAGRPGAIVGDRIVDLQDAMNVASVLELLQRGEGGMSQARSVVEAAATDAEMQAKGALVSDVVLLAPIPRPTSMRDGYAFRQHVEAARRNRGVEMIPEFDLFPVFYFTNHQAVTGPGDVAVQDLHLNRLDFELECAIVIGREGRNIKASEADEYIAGYTVMNDWSARALQMEEMKLSLGPAKGKDFATSIGPYLATRDELAARRIPGESGERYDLAMATRVNGTEVSRGNLRDMTWTFAQILERASYGVTLYPGDVIGSGTVGTGCFLELNGSKISDNWWLKDGDVVECEIDLLGTLRNTVKRVGP
ncbi:MAG TPA: fumarylacetoacetate hydrolase family protein [Candidatus Kapabacteria bacterium]|nr:fumarylacetoacetate hydrolase family protein [Candidatus Kapabacteria bacterium]